MSYVYKRYPAHVHKAGGVFLEVNDTAEEEQALADGWALAPVPDVPAEPRAAVVPAKRGPGRPRNPR